MEPSKWTTSGERYLPLHHEARHNSAVNFRRTGAVIALVAGLFPILVPYFHIGIVSHLWDQYKFDVDVKKCECPCWDTVFKGPYERGPSGYKHIYFNATSNTIKIWSVTILAVILLYEAVKKVLHLLHSKEMRISMFALLALSVYPHYYSWWSYFNYWNDDFYSQWNHQLFFSSTELASTLMVAHLMDRRVPITSSKCLFIVAIALLHILSAGFDQFVENVVRGNGMLHQVLRDVFFMVPDLCHVAFPMLELKLLARQNGLQSAFHAISTQQFGATVLFIGAGWVFCQLI